MAEFKTVANEHVRMCEFYVACSGCPLNRKEIDNGCSFWVLRHPEEAETLIMKWAAEHPIVTNGMKFREVFGHPYEQWFAVTGVEAQWLNAEYKEDSHD